MIPGFSSFHRRRVVANDLDAFWFVFLVLIDNTSGVAPAVGKALTRVVRRIEYRLPPGVPQHIKSHTE